MQLDACGGWLAALLFFLVGLKLVLGPFGGVGEGFWEGFWAAVWGRILLGPRSAGAANPIGCLVVVLLPLVALIVLLVLLVLLVVGFLGPLLL